MKKKSKTKKKLSSRKKNSTEFSRRGAKRGGNPSKSPSTFYFSKKTEDAIVRYNAEPDFETRNRIYNESIAEPLSRLAENIINTFKFSYFDDSMVNIRQDVVSFMVEKLGQFDASKGKAFSYFSIVAKNYLILMNNSNYKRFKIHDGVEAVDAQRNHYAEDRLVESDEEVKEFVDMMVEFWENNITSIFKKERDIQIANAVIELFRKRDTIENFNKKALYVYVREITRCNTQQITRVINTMRSRYQLLVDDYNEQGLIDTENIFKNRFF